MLLVSAPFATLHKPSIGLSLMKGALGSRAIDAQIHYANLDFARLVGDGIYQRLAEGEPSTELFVGEWIFSAALGSDEPRSAQPYLDEVLLDPRHRWLTRIDEALLSAILELRSQAEAFVDDCVQQLLRFEPRIVGFTSLYQQHVCSLALAQRLKRQLPETFLVLGGSNCEGVMGAETLRQFGFIDAVISGEAEQAFPDLVEQVLSGEPPVPRPGVYLRSDIARRFEEQRFENTRVIADLDSLPPVSYGDYFDQYAAAAETFENRRLPDILFETSRGCWFGEKCQCAFCGLNGSDAVFRSKSASRALQELETLIERHPGSTINVTDNILDHRYFDDLIPLLGARDGDLHIYFSTKSNLSRSQIAALKKAGISSIQAGIESLANDVLKRMRKGVTRLQNIQLLKWCAAFGVTPYWNILWGFPGESPADYLEMAALIPKLAHLQPPFRCGPLHLDRFSPHFNQAEAYGFRKVRPFPAYHHIFPVADEAVANLAYYFTHDDPRQATIERYTRPLLQAIEAWQETHEESALISQVRGTALHIWDLRPGAEQRAVVLDGVARRLYEASDARQNLRHLAEFVDENGAPLGVDRVEDVLGPLIERGLLLRDRDQVLSLAVPLDHYEPSYRVMAKFAQIAFNASGDGVARADDGGANDTIE